MTRLGRAEVFAPEEIAICHIISRVVRRCFLLGDDPVTGKNFDHRKLWIERLLERLSAGMGIDLLCFSIMSNHFHLVLRSRPDVVQMWDDTEVARRWLRLCPQRKTAGGEPAEPTEAELNSIRTDPSKLKTIRLRLSDMSWWMRLLCQHIGSRANREEEESGKFFQGRFKAVRLLDEAAIVACAAYVDLNPIRAAMAETVEESDFTSAQRRALALQAQQKQSDVWVEAQVGFAPKPEEVTATESGCGGESDGVKAPDGLLSPVEIDELRDTLGACPSSLASRCSDKGFLPMTSVDYLQLLDWTARQSAPGKRGTTLGDAPAILERLGLEPATWCVLVKEFGRLFSAVAGRPQTIDSSRTLRRRRRHHMRREARELLTT